MENWIIKQVKLRKDRDSLTNIIGSISWELEKTKDGQTAKYNGTIELGEPDRNNFVDSSDITEDTIKNWLEKAYTDGAKAIFNKRLDFDLAKLTDNIFVLNK
jgi:hypothetical protein